METNKKNPVDYFDYVYSRTRPSYYGRRLPVKYSGEYGSLHRAVFGVDAPDGGVGVSYFDPILSVPDDYDGSYELRAIPKGYGLNNFNVNSLNIKEILSVGLHADTLLGQELNFGESLLIPNSSLKQFWRRAFYNGNASDDEFLVGWSCHHRRHVFYDDDCRVDVLDEVVPNDFTARPFNYFFLRYLVEHDELWTQVQSYKYFTDSARVNRRCGYWSPAYALALGLSLKKHGLVESALNNFISFCRYHPYDPIVASDELRAIQKFEGLEIAPWGVDPRIENQLSIREEAEEYYVMVQREEDDYRRREECDNEEDHPFFVDDCPVYEADDEEDAEIIYWNTH